MGVGSSNMLPDLMAWIAMQNANKKIPPPSPNSIRRYYAQVVNYAYLNPTKSTIYLQDIQRRFFEKTCYFLWTWSEQKPSSSFDALLQTVDALETPGDAVEAYRKVVTAISQNPSEYKDILSDFQTRYFDPRYPCNPRQVSDPSVYLQDLGPVFR
jgi:hypothetical protein